MHILTALYVCGCNCLLIFLIIIQEGLSRKKETWTVGKKYVIVSVSLLQPHDEFIVS